MADTPGESPVADKIEKKWYVKNAGLPEDLMRNAIITDIVAQVRTLEGNYMRLENERKQLVMDLREAYRAKSLKDVKQILDDLERETSLRQRT